MTKERTLSTSRFLPYAPRAIYDTFASAELLAQWWGPEGFSNFFEIFEFRVGGRWKFVMHGPDGSNYPNECIFAELVPGAKVVIQHVCPPYFTLRVGLTPVNEGTQLIWEQVFDDVQTARAVEQIVVPANEQNIDRLTQVLSRGGNSA